MPPSETALRGGAAGRFVILHIRVFGADGKRRTSTCGLRLGASVSATEGKAPGIRDEEAPYQRGFFIQYVIGAEDEIRTRDTLLGKHYPICAVLQTWEQSEMLSSYLLMRLLSLQS